MLDTTLATEFIPSTNLKGEVAGANWSFLLPSLELERIVCFGALSSKGYPAWLISLARLCSELVVICVDERMAQVVDEAVPAAWTGECALDQPGRRGRPGGCERLAGADLRGDAMCAG